MGLNSHNGPVFYNHGNGEVPTLTAKKGDRHVVDSAAPGVKLPTIRCGIKEANS